MEEQKKTGKILRIERSSLHDGPGMRTVVFFKGCPLRCRWCSTPESQLTRSEFGFCRERCVSCGKCTEVCPQKALQLQNGIPVRNERQCTFCRRCESVCVQDAWTVYGYDISADALMEEIEKDEIFYFHSGGGVTLSGGEVLAQADFAAEILKRCKLRGYHTAIESCLYGSKDSLDKILPNLDWLYCDIKLFDGQCHRSEVQADNRLILENLKWISQSAYNTSVHVRIPLVPGINDDAENLIQTAEFCRNLEKVQEIELLPYHRLGLKTYDRLGRTYSLQGVQEPSDDHMARCVRLMQARLPGISVRRG